MYKPLKSLHDKIIELQNSEDLSLDDAVNMVKLCEEVQDHITSMKNEIENLRYELVLWESTND